MKGHIFNLLENFIIETAGDAAFEKVYNNCKFEGEGIFIRPGNYPDADLFELVNQTVSHLEITHQQAHRSFGKWMFKHLAKLVPEPMVKVEHPKTFLMQLNQIHEVELKKLWPDAFPPRFECEDTGANTMRFTYDSPRQLFDLVDGVLEGVAEYYSAPMTWSKSNLMMAIIQPPVGKSNSGKLSH